MKRGRLYACARREGYNLLAMGQHLDDLAERCVLEIKKSLIHFAKPDWRKLTMPSSRVQPYLREGPFCLGGSVSEGVLQQQQQKQQQFYSHTQTVRLNIVKEYKQ